MYREPSRLVAGSARTRHATLKQRASKAARSSAPRPTRWSASCSSVSVRSSSWSAPASISRRTEDGGRVKIGGGPRPTRTAPDPPDPPRTTLGTPGYPWVPLGTPGTSPPECWAPLLTRRHPPRRRSRGRAPPWSASHRSSAAQRPEAGGCWTAADHRARAAMPGRRDGPGVTALMARNAALSSLTSWAKVRANKDQTSVKRCLSSRDRSRRMRSPPFGLSSRQPAA